MITIAIRKRLYTTDDNHYIIYVPLFRKANMDASDATLPATALCISGIENTLKVGDVVYIGFEDNNFNRPVILSKLYTQEELSEILDGEIPQKFIEHLIMTFIKGLDNKKD